MKDTPDEMRQAWETRRDENKTIEMRREGSRRDMARKWEVERPEDGTRIKSVFFAHVVLERLKALTLGHLVEVKGQGVKKCVYHNGAPNEFLFPSASLIRTEVHTSAEQSSRRGRETPYGLSDVYKRSPSLIQHWKSNHSFTAPYHFLRLDITSWNKEGIFPAPWNIFIVNDRNSLLALIIIHRNTTGSYRDMLQYHNNSNARKTPGLGKESKRNLMQNRNKGHTKVSRLKFLFNIHKRNVFSIECLGLVFHSCPPVYEPGQALRGDRVD